MPRTRSGYLSSSPSTSPMIFVAWCAGSGSPPSASATSWAKASTDGHAADEHVAQRLAARFGVVDRLQRRRDRVVRRLRDRVHDRHRLLAAARGRDRALRGPGSAAGPTRRAPRRSRPRPDAGHACLVEVGREPRRRGRRPSVGVGVVPALGAATGTTRVPSSLRTMSMAECSLGGRPRPETTPPYPRLDPRLVRRRETPRCGPQPVARARRTCAAPSKVSTSAPGQRARAARRCAEGSLRFRRPPITNVRVAEFARARAVGSRARPTIACSCALTATSTGPRLVR